MILHPNFVFIHNPRTGGESISDALGGFTAENAEYTPKWIKPDDWQHLPLARIHIKGRLSFGFVRNPWARLVSLHRYLDMMAGPGEPFKQWLTDGTDHITEDPRGLPLQRRPQLWWLNGCTFVGQFENIEDDFAHALMLIGLHPRPLPHVNATTGGDWRAEYDVETRAFVAHHFAPDIARFGYRFE